MADVRPFRGIYYNPKKAWLEDVVAPPYDVIPAEMQIDLYDKSAYNVIRLILGREADRYSSAAAFFEEWQHDEILLRDHQPCIYLLEQRFRFSGTWVERKGLIAACRLEPFAEGSIFPHERTLSKPKEDRLRLFEATRAMFSQVFSLYADSKGILDPVLDPDTPPDMEVEFEGVTNSLWKMTDPIAIASIAHFLRDQRIIVADGHHRYETALAYRDAQRLKNPGHTGREAYNFVPMFLTNMLDPHLVVLPTHRILRDVVDFNPVLFLSTLGNFFTVSTLSSAEELFNRLRKAKPHAFGMALQLDPGFYFLSLKNQRLASAKPLFSDASLLQSVVFKDILRLSDEALERRLYLDYEADAPRAIDAVREQGKQAAFILNPTPIEQVRASAEAGLTLPQKSTYFYPKLLSGLIMYSFRD